MLDWLSGAIQGTLGNYLTRLFDCWFKTPVQANDSRDHVEAPIRSFQSFHIEHDLEGVLMATPDPIVHVLIEEQRTTAYHVCSLVVESLMTGEWYASDKAMAYEGHGGGRGNAEFVGLICQELGVRIIGWVCDKQASDDLAHGYRLWPSVKTELVPLFSYSKNKYISHTIAGRFRQFNGCVSPHINGPRPRRRALSIGQASRV